MDLLYDISAGHAAESRLLERVPRSSYGIKVWALRQMETSVRASEEESRTSGEEEPQKLLAACKAESSHHAVWLLLSKSAARKLDYDARVCPCEELQEAMARGEVAVVSTLQSLLGRPIDRDTLAQAVLPGPLGGRGLRMTSRCADANFFERTRATEYLVREATGTEHEFMDNHLMRAAQEGLRVKGIVVSGARDVTLTDWADQTVNAGLLRDRHNTKAILAPMRSVFVPPMRLAGRIIGAMDTIEATKLWERAGPWKKTQMLEEGGQGVGTVCGLRDLIHARISSMAHSGEMRHSCVWGYGMTPTT